MPRPSSLIPLLLLLSACTAAPRAQDAVQVWWSAELQPESPIWYTDPPPPSAIRYTLDRQPDLTLQPETAPAPTIVRIDTGTTFQEIRGIGTSLEATTLYAIRTGSDEAAQRAILRALLDPITGMGFTLFRITIGTSDFSDGRAVSDHPQGYYTYQNREDQPFSIQPDRDLGIVAMLRLAQDVAAALDQPIRFFASSWSPPGWMKTSGTLIGGTLKPGYEPRLARYYRQFVEAYEAEGIPIYAITMQNEPNFVPTTYPGMRLTWQQERDLVVATYEAFQTAPALDVRLWINDHNFDAWVNADSVLTSLAAMDKKHYVDAVAFHNYDPAYPASNMARLQAKHPETGLVFTEHAEWGTAGMHNIQQYFWHGAETYVYWVTATTEDLDEHNQGPYNRLGELSPTLIIKRADGSWYVTPEFYLLAQFSRFVRPGARRLACDRGTPETVTAVCFRNPDASVVAVLVNQTATDQPVTLALGDRAIRTTLPYESVGTYVWQP